MKHFMCIVLLIYPLALFSQDEHDMLTVILPGFTVQMPQFYDEEGNADECIFYIDRSDQYEDIILEFTLWDGFGPYGDVFNNELSIIPGDTTCAIVNIEQRLCTDLFFNEDGCGGVWTIVGVTGAQSEWMNIERIDEYHYRTLTEEELSTTKPEITAQSVAAADTYIEKCQIPTTYDENSSSSTIRIEWTIKSDTFALEMQFLFEYGD